MTYWPISSPSVFAATKHTNPERTRVSNDGIEDGVHEARRDAPNDGAQPQDQDAGVAQGEGAVKEEGRARPQQPRASDQLLEDDIHGEIIAIRVTRSGHMFATLTQSTLTIWQTKACLHSCVSGLLLIRYIAHGCSSFSLAFQAVGQDIRP
jgi:hypothetical protein